MGIKYVQLFTVKVIHKVVFLSFEMNGVRRQGVTDREGAQAMIDVLQASIDNPVSNINGKTVTGRG